MKYNLSQTSLDRLEGVDSRLVELAKLAITRTPIDFGVAWMGGVRTAEQQKELFDQGFSKCDGYKIKSYHQSGKAVDFCPYVGSKPVNDSIKMCLILAGVVASCASELGIKVRWGGNWAQDSDPRDNKFDDLFHFEIRD